ncbi:formate dehydrogenase subunit alpha, partial [Candidatus Bathyarchaeota archaeon]
SVVRIEGWDRYPLATVTKAEDGMKVITKTEKLQQIRRNILEMILAITGHPTSCLFCERKEECGSIRECMRKFPVTSGCRYCPKDGECEIQTVVKYTELKEIRFSLPQKQLPVLKEPFFDRNYNLCILCGRCVRMCEEVRGEGILKFHADFHRNHWIEPTSLFESNCKFCGACVDACPTGALIARFEKWEKPEKTTVTLCPYCGCGCSIEVGTNDNRIVRVRGKRDGSVNEAQLCVKGRVGLLFTESQERLKKPLIKENGSFRETSWDEALDLVANKFSEYKGDQIAVLTSAKCTNEENYLAQKFARAVLKTNNIDHCARLCHSSTVVGLSEAFGSGAMTNSINDIEKANCIFVIGSNTTEQHPIVALKIKNAKKKGATLIVADPRKIELAEIADIWIRHRPGTDVMLSLGICKVIVDEGIFDERFIKERCEGFEQFQASLKDISLREASKITGIDERTIEEAAHTYATRKPASIIYAMGITQHTTGTDNVRSLANLAMLCGNLGMEGGGVNPLRGQNNVQGACDMGGLPNVYSGYQKVNDASARKKMEKAWSVKGLPEEVGLTVTETIQAAHQGRLKAMYVIGENPALSDPDTSHVKEGLKRLQFLVVQDIFLTETARLADLVLPAASPLEKEGTFTNTERRVQRVRKVLFPPGEAKEDWKIISEIAKRMGYSSQFAYNNPSEIMKEIASVTPSYAGITYERIETKGIQWPCPSEDHPGTSILHRDGFIRGKGQFSVIKYSPPAELPDNEYPFILTTGRILFHYHTGTMTRRVPDLSYIRNEEFVEINPSDAERLSIKNGDAVEVESRRGSVTAKAKLTERSPEGVLFMTFHFSEACANVLTLGDLDPVAKIPELKVCAVKIKKEV